MLTIMVKFVNGGFKAFTDIEDKNATVADGVLVIASNQKVDEHGKWLSGKSTRIPIANVLYFESTQTINDVTVEGEGKVVE